MRTDMTEPHDIEEKTRLTLSQHVAFKAACDEVGIKRADVMRALIVNFIRRQHVDKGLQALGLSATAGEGTE